MLARSLDHVHFEKLVLQLHDAVRAIPHQREFTARERELLNRLHLHIGTTVPSLQSARLHVVDPTVMHTMAANDERLCAIIEALTRAESELLLLVRQGLSNKEIADRLGKSIRTVKTQLTSVYKKFSVRSRSRLLALLV